MALPIRIRKSGMVKLLAVMLFSLVPSSPCDKSDTGDFMEEISYLEEYRDQDTGFLMAVDLYGYICPVDHELTIGEKLRMKGQWLIDHGYPRGTIYLELSDAWERSQCS